MKYYFIVFGIFLHYYFLSLCIWRYVITRVYHHNKKIKVNTTIKYHNVANKKSYTKNTKHSVPILQDNLTITTKHKKCNHPEGDHRGAGCPLVVLCGSPCQTSWLVASASMLSRVASMLIRAAVSQTFSSRSRRYIIGTASPLESINMTDPKRSITKARVYLQYNIHK